MEKRGIRNNNPANLRRSLDKWDGLSLVQQDKAFFQFRAMKYGVRALLKTLYTYVHKHNLHTVKDIIERFAPTNENNTYAYVHSIETMMSSKYTNMYYRETDFYNHSDMLFLLCVCICKIESKYTLTHTMFMEAWRLANFK